MKKIYILSFVFFLIDLISKLLILSFEKNLPITIINNFFCLEKVTNKGAAFSMLTGYGIVLIIIAIFVIIYIHKFIIKDIKTKLGFFSLSMLIGGIIGNLFDRIVYGEVIDFLSFDIFGYNFPIFNLADTFICTGVLLLIIDYMKGEKNENRSKK